MTDPSRPSRIVSLLPALTELVGALGRASELVGVTHECDVPAEVERLPRLTRTRIAPDASSAAIDAMVSSAAEGLYELDGSLMERLAPDLILTQEQCDVCAVDERTVRRLAWDIPSKPLVECVNPTDLAGVFAMFRRVGEILGASDRAEAIVAEFHTTVGRIQRRLVEQPPRSTLLLEWLDPPFSSGHWNPEIVRLAGGVEPLAASGAASRRLTWKEIASADPEIIILAPCGFTLDRAEAELPVLSTRPIWSSLRAVRSGNVTLVDGNSFFARPGPRLETSLRIAAASIHPERCTDLAPPEGDGWKRLAT